MIRTLVIVGLVSLAACSPNGKGAGDQLEGPPGEIFPVPPEYGLAFNDLGANSTLTFGAPESDDVQLQLNCYKGSGRIMASDFWQDGPDVTLRSGQARAAVTGKVRGPDPETKMSWVDFWARPGDPPLAAFRATGELELRSGGKALLIKARPAEMAAVEGFFATCEKPNTPARP